ncbi:MAG: DMT family transporter [Nocardioidaceae bacterium]|nr:DMT family transporter [Nocardioidaceae bacterium]MDQ3165659.1 DMT family transporter [Actinomycetota bacterium]
MSSRVAAPAGRRSGLATLALVGVTASWGSTFFLIKDLLDRVPAADFLALRFCIAAVVLAVVSPAAVRRMSRRARRQGLVLGGVYGVAQLLQTIGLESTDASVSGFITGMYVVATPVLAGWLLRERIPHVVWLAIALSTAGLAVLSLRGLSIGPGEALTFAAAMLYALHIVGLGAWSSTQDAYGLAVLQMAVIAVVAALPTAYDGITLPTRADDWVAVLYMALVSGALALLAQTWAQAHLTATRAAIVMTLEPVFAAAFAVALGGESVTTRMAVGGGFVLAAMYLVELTPGRHLEGEVPHLAQ